MRPFVLLVPWVSLAATPIGFQLHSYNDLREWHQLPFKAGFFGNPDALLSMKVDFNTLTEEGTFLMTHDDPQPGVAYDNSGSMLGAVEQLLHSSPRLRLRIALCFKQYAALSSGPCADNAAATQWIAAVDAFYSAAQGLVQSYPGRLEWVLDGMAKPQDCLAQRWRPWNATWIPGDSSPPLAWASDDQGLGYDRYAILNPSASSIPVFQVMGHLGFGKFKNGPYPLQVWEPDDQPSLIDYGTSFVSSRPNGHYQMHNAINIDPAMWAIFTSKVTGAAWNHELSTHAKDVTKPHLVPVGNSRYLILYTPTGAAHASYLQITGEVFSTPSSTVENSLGVAVLAAAAGLASSGLAPVFVLTAEAVQEYTVATSGAMVLEHSVPLSRRLRGAIAIASGPGGVAVLTVSKRQVDLRYVDFENGSDTDAGWPAHLNPGSIESAAVVRAGSVWIVAVSNGTHVSVSTGKGWVLAGVGRSVSLAAGEGSDPTVVLVVDGGFCYNGNTINRQAAFKVCDASPTPCPVVMDYTLGRAQQWVAWSRSVELAGSCGSLLHGTYDFGNNPSAAIVHLPAGAAVVAVHEVPRSADTCGCGTPEPRNLGGLVLDGWAFYTEAQEDAVML